MIGRTMKLKLHPVTYGVARNRFCGPSALSILTGLDTGRCAALLRRVSGRACIKGTYTGEMRKALRELGIDSLGGGVLQGTNMTLAQWSKRTRESRGQGTYLIVVGHHWAVVQGRRFACGWATKSVPLGRAPKRRRRVTAVYSLVRLHEVKLAQVAPPVVRKIDTERKAREEAKRLIALYQLDFDDCRPGDDLCWVYPPAAVDGRPFPDPRADEHYAYGWSEVLDLAREYAAAIEAFRAQPPVPPRVDPLVNTICLDSTPQSATLLA